MKLSNSEETNNEIRAIPSDADATVSANINPNVSPYLTGSIVLEVTCSITFTAKLNPPIFCSEPSHIEKNKPLLNCIC